MSLTSKSLWITLVGVVLSFTPSVNAQLPLSGSPSFEDLLPTLLTSKEAEAYQAIGQQKAVQLAQQTCRALNSGQSIEDYLPEVAQAIASSGINSAQASMVGGFSGKVIAAAVATLCPEHTTQLQQLRLP